jgi:hypothetical protein
MATGLKRGPHGELSNSGAGRLFFPLFLSAFSFPSKSGYLFFDFPTEILPALMSFLICPPAHVSKWRWFSVEGLLAAVGQSGSLMDSPWSSVVFAGGSKGASKTRHRNDGDHRWMIGRAAQDLRSQ